MDEASQFTVSDRNSERGRGRTTGARLDGGATVVVELEGGRAVEVPAAALVEQQPGSYLLRGDFADFADFAAPRRAEVRDDDD